MNVPGFPIALVLLVLAVMITVGYFSYLQQKRRREELGSLADELGWQFDSGSDHAHDDQYAQFAIFRRGHGRYAYNTLTGETTIDGRPYFVRMGDYQYRVTSGSGKQRRTRTYRFSYIILHLPLRPDAGLLIRPQGLLDSLAGSLGFGDVELESAEFNRRFYVSSTDKRFAYDLLHPQMMEFLLDAPPPVIDMEHGCCCLSESQRQWSAEEFRSRLQWSGRFFELWPRHLIRNLELQS